MIFLDLDGVIVNFTKGFAQKAKVALPPKSYLEYGHMEKVLGKRVWTYKLDYDFWINLDPYPWSNDLVDLVESYDKDFRFLSAAVYDQGAWSGKYQWLKNHFGQKYTKKLIICISDKSFAARDKKSILIDDRDKNIKNFIAAGGSAITWKERTEDMLEETRRDLSSLESEIKSLI